MISRHPEIVSKVVLTNCDVLENFLPTMFKPLTYAARWFPSLLGSTIKAATKSQTLAASPLLLGWLTKKPLDWPQWQSFLAGIHSNQLVLDQFVRFAAGADSKYTIAAATTFSTFTKPVLIAWANEAPVFEPKWATRLNALFPNSEIKWISDSYAMIPEDNPADLVAEIRTFLEK